MMHLTPLTISFAAAVLVSAVSREQLPNKDGDIKFIDDIWNEAPVKVAKPNRPDVKTKASRSERINDVRPARTGGLHG